MTTELLHQMEGDKICFTALNRNDAVQIHKYASDKEVSRFIGWRLMESPDETIRHVEQMLKRESEGTHFYASVTEKYSCQIIGTAMMFNFDREAGHAEIGYVLSKPCWGRGFGTEVVRLLKTFAFEVLELHKLHARVAEANAGSCRVLEKNGFVLEGRLKDYYFIEGRYYDGRFYGFIP
ncbi:GNAT family N-acetyltransferase [Ruminiclostridium cellobioparum]|jgi:ribosomal-protein-alanine N-acetyltransferase|uniref:GNAT family N-acetyltransferase n=1 Tax=Ruminiclostridium cellobioparum TaxID=29355 RepID=UPI0028ACD4C0|nr:GNAT family N-acetyltransferase [Ruminiclostridium cellobioparum]